MRRMRRARRPDQSRPGFDSLSAAGRSFCRGPASAIIHSRPRHPQPRRTSFVKVMLGAVAGFEAFDRAEQPTSVLRTLQIEGHFIAGPGGNGVADKDPVARERELYALYVLAAHYGTGRALVNVYWTPSFRPVSRRYASSASQTFRVGKVRPSGPEVLDRMRASRDDSGTGVFFCPSRERLRWREDRHGSSILWRNGPDQGASPSRGHKRIW